MKKQSNKKRFKTRTTLVLVCLLMYIPFLFNWTQSQGVSVQLLRMGTIEDAIESTAYIIRNEQVYQSKLNGNYIQGAMEGEKASMGFCIATALGGQSEELLKKLDEKREKLLEVFHKNKENQALFEEDIQRIEDNIGWKVDAMIEKSHQQTFSRIDRLKTEINGYIEKKADILSGIPSADTYVNLIKKEEQQIKNQVESHTEKIITKSSGIVSYRIDGYEAVLMPDQIAELTPEKLDQIKLPDKNKLYGKQVVEAEKPFVKVVDPLYCHMVLVLDTKQATQFQTEDVVTVRITDIRKEIATKIDRISAVQDGKQLVTLKIDRYISELAGFRIVSVDLIKKDAKGLKAPLKSLLNVNAQEGTASMVLVKANLARYTDIKIILMNDQYAIITRGDPNSTKGVSLYDLFVTNPKNIEEGQIINQ